MRAQPVDATPFYSVDPIEPVIHVEKGNVHAHRTACKFNSGGISGDLHRPVSVLSRVSDDWFGDLFDDYYGHRSCCAVCLSGAVLFPMR